MFSSLKGFSSNINSNYTVSQNVTSTAGAWKLYDAKKKSTGKAYTVFVFDKKSLETQGNSLSRSSAAALKRATDEVVERLKKEASSLARLRHPSILELVEPVEDTRGGGLQFVTEPVTASLASLLQEKDDQERSGGVGGRSSRFVTEDSDGVKRRRELEIDELEIQKGLLQVSKALEFLHENAGLVHCNLTPEAILVNAKSDWKVSGLAFCSPPSNSDKATSFQPISLSETLNLDPRLPRFVQLNLDYTSPDFVMDNNLTTSADMFSLGLLCIALYNSPHRSPIEANSSPSTYKRVFSSSSSVPNQNNQFLSSRALPRDLSAHVLPRLITRRPAQRMSAREFQDSEYFDNILVSTIRFLDAFPAKTSNEKASFMRGLNKVLPSFPKSVMEKKVLPALLEELKDKELMSLILQNVFKIIELLPSARRAFTEKVRPRLKEIFIDFKPTGEKDPSRDAGIMVVLENVTAIANNCGGKEFKDDILPILMSAIESPTPAIVDVAMKSLPSILPVLDFSTIKNELFPVIATVFSKTTSLAIKVRGLQAFVILCGGSLEPTGNDGLDGVASDKKKGSSSALDKYTMQEKIVPLIKLIKTKEPAVMLAALNVLRIIGEVADADFVAMDIIPILWGMSLGPLLDLNQFQSFMELIKSLSRRVEDEQTKKLQELSGMSNGGKAAPEEDFMAFGGLTGTAFDATNGGASEDDFERLVKGKASVDHSNTMDASWDANPSPALASPPAKSSTPTPAFSWSTPSPTGPASGAGTFGATKASQPALRTVTPDLGRFEALAPSSTQFSTPLQPSNLSSMQTMQPIQPAASSFASPQSSSSVGWSTAGAQPNPWASSNTSTPASPPASNSYGFNQRPTITQPQPSSFSLAPPPGSGGINSTSGFSLAPPPGGAQRSTFVQPTMGSFGGSMKSTGNSSMNSMNSMNGMVGGTNNSMGRGMGMGHASSGSLGGSSSMNSMMGGMSLTPQQPAQPPQQQQQQGSGLDKYESLL